MIPTLLYWKLYLSALEFRYVFVWYIICLVATINAFWLTHYKSQYQALTVKWPTPDTPPPCSDCQVTHPDTQPSCSDCHVTHTKHTSIVLWLSHDPPQTHQHCALTVKWPTPDTPPSCSDCQVTHPRHTSIVLWLSSDPPQTHLHRALTVKWPTPDTPPLCSDCHVTHPRHTTIVLWLSSDPPQTHHHRALIDQLCTLLPSTLEFRHQNIVHEPTLVCMYHSPLLSIYYHTL